MLCVDYNDSISLLNTTIRRRLPGKFTRIYQFLFYIPKSGFGDISSVLLGFEKNNRIFELLEFFYIG